MRVQCEKDNVNRQWDNCFMNESCNQIMMMKIYYDDDDAITSGLTAAGDCKCSLQFLQLQFTVTAAYYCIETNRNYLN